MGGQFREHRHADVESGVSRGVVAAVSVKPRQSIVASIDAPTSRTNVIVPASVFGADAGSPGRTQTSSGRISRRTASVARGVSGARRIARRCPPGSTMASSPSHATGRMLPRPMKSATNSLTGSR